MAKKTGEISNKDLFCLIENLDKKVDARFQEIQPYLETWDDVRSAGRVARWVMGTAMTLGAFYLMILNILHK